MFVLARTTAQDKVEKRTQGLSVFLVELRRGHRCGPDDQADPHDDKPRTTEIFFEDVRVPAANLIGTEGDGFRYILSGMNAERILIAAECIGDARWFIARATDYANERVVFGRPIGMNQGVQFPIARAYAQMRAAALMVDEAARRYESGQSARRKPIWRNCSRPMPRGPPPTCVCRPMAVSARPRRWTSSENFATRACSDRTDLDQHDLVLHRRTRARSAALIF